MQDAYLFLRAVGVLQLQVVKGRPVRGKDQPPGIRAPDGHGVSGGIEGKPLGASALQIISPDVGILARDVRHTYGHRFSARSYEYVAIHIGFSNRSQPFPLAVKPRELRKGNPTPALSGQQAFVGGPKYRPLDLRLVLNIVQNSCWFPCQSEALQIESLGEQSLIPVKQQIAWRGIGRVCRGFHDESFLNGVQ